MPDKNNTFLDFNLPQDAYAAFDAVSLKDFIIQRLNENEKFTDQNFEGSNLAAVIDIIAYSYHVLLFYLNNTASESTFDQATLYENMNKIVKLIGYKPVGKKTSLASIRASASKDLAVGNYTIRKNSFFLVDSIAYTFNDDYSFTISEAKEQKLPELDNNVILFQGTLSEYPDYIAQGENFESVTVVVDNILDKGDSRFIADDTLSVFVKEANSNTYFEYKEVDSLYIKDSNARVYEKRLNENGHFEIKFGDGTSGKKLQKGDVVSINYILSDGEKGIISTNAINGNKLFSYDSSRQRQIFDDTYANKDTTTFITAANNSNLTFVNPQPSSPITDEETVEEIRENAPKLFSSQERLVSIADYESFLNKNFTNILIDSKVVSNQSFINDYIQYFYDICVDPDKSNRVLINQVNFSDSCDFNNINIFTVPRFNIIEDGDYPPFLSNSIKKLIVDSSLERKTVSHEVVPRDPIYMAFDLGFSNRSDLVPDISNETNLVIIREANNKINKEILKSKVLAIITKFFNSTNNILGQKISLSTLVSEILSVEGIKRIETRNNEENISFRGISFISFNPLYPSADISLVNQDETLPFFKFPFLINPKSLAAKLTVIDE
tara:strand:+ start:1486 stop:3315 length:1830 start_codon:yes stop_codon:yes gene_type:complete